ncbi:hypothetical protein IV203_026261 [Nitzschia inconspicua]|uniref:Uncharacterized protein n=1 Tax=Nitzschia inconspicua TaxID=303405 RepID=A0A9K3LLC6_9STRA|nr:hypothetical protein IV203_026261 [Nitzschia inconspicua]
MMMTSPYLSIRVLMLFLLLLCCRNNNGIYIAAFQRRSFHQISHRHGQCSNHGSSQAQVSPILSASSSNSSNNNDNANRDRPTIVPSRSVGDVVQGLHGSKYQFQNFPFEGQQFAETGYTSGNYQGDPSAVQASMAQEPLPEWAIRWQQTFVPPKGAMELNVFLQQQQQQQQEPITISIRNDERSWEKFYTFVLWREEEEEGVGTPCSIDASYLIKVTPKLGMLAPRGSRDANFSDTVPLQVSAKINDPEAVGKLWLLVGTEAEKWVYKLV